MGCLRYEDVYGDIPVYTPAWNGGAVYYRQLIDNGFFSLKIKPYSVGVIVGLADDPSGEGYLNMSHALHVSRGRVDVLEYGQSKLAASGRPYLSNDHTLHIVRREGVVYYCISTPTTPVYSHGLPGDIFYQSTLWSSGPVYLDASLYNIGDEILSVELTEGYGDQKLWAAGEFGLAGSCSSFMCSQIIGEFSLQGTAGGRGKTRADGEFSVPGLCSDHAYGEARGSFGLEGYALEGLHEEISGAFGFFELIGAASMSQYFPAQGHGQFSLVGRASSYLYSDAQGTFGFFGYATGRRADIENYFNIELELIGHKNDVCLARETLLSANMSTIQPVYGLKEILGLAAAPSLDVVFHLLCTERLILASSIQYVALSMAAEGFNLADSSALNRRLLLDVAETLSLLAGTSTTLAVAIELAETLVLQDVANFVQLLSAEETIALADTLSTQIHAWITADESLILTDTVQSSLMFVASDSYNLGDTGAVNLRAMLRAEEVLAFLTNIPIGDEAYSGYVMNSDTTGMTTYSQFPFNSLFTHEGITYGVTETGLYELAGDTDEGIVIPADWMTGDIDFGTSHEKNVPRTFLYVLQSGDLILSTISSRYGQRAVTWYEVPLRDVTDDEGVRRVHLGRGVNGVHWQFKLTNVDGADFLLKGAEVMPVVLTRRG